MSKVSFKVNRVREITGMSIPKIAEKMGKTRQQVYLYFKDDQGCSMKMAMQLEQATGISHQFFLYPYAVGSSFLPKKDA
jgi:plasmid maintenance system antidote protein VapI